MGKDTKNQTSKDSGSASQDKAKPHDSSDAATTLGFSLEKDTGVNIAIMVRNSMPPPKPPKTKE
jgi:hypothetical protein